MKHMQGVLKEIEIPNDVNVNFEKMCRDILIKEGIIKMEDHPLTYGSLYWSDILEKELGDKYVVVQDWCLVDRLFEICKFGSEIIEEGYDFIPTSYDREYAFDIVCDESKSFSEALSREVYSEP